MSQRLRRVGIGLPVFNWERFLEETLDSSLGQTHGEFLWFCPQHEFVCWREVWLRQAEEDIPDAALCSREAGGP